MRPLHLTRLLIPSRPIIQIRSQKTAVEIPTQLWPNISLQMATFPIVLCIPLPSQVVFVFWPFLAQWCFFRALPAIGPEKVLGLYISHSQNCFSHTISTCPLGFMNIWTLQGATHSLKLNPPGHPWPWSQTVWPDSLRERCGINGHQEDLTSFLNFALVSPSKLEVTTHHASLC